MEGGIKYLEQNKMIQVPRKVALNLLRSKQKTLTTITKYVHPLTKHALKITHILASIISK